ncbi:hypothetical protein J6A31_00775 [bacterium]|nr:hypothetical protein [bacterium]
MGCLKNIFIAIILAFAFIGFMSVGGGKLVTNLVKNYLNPPQETLAKRAEKVGNFSEINEEFEIEKAAGMLGYNGVIAEHKASGQKLIVVDTNNKPILTAEDIKSDEIEQKLIALTQKIKYQTFQVDELKITKRGIINSYGKDSPYIKFEAKAKKLPIGEVAGIISVTETINGEQRLLISANEKKRYSQLISDEFFKSIK